MVNFHTLFGFKLLQHIFEIHTAADFPNHFGVVKSATI